MRSPAGLSPALLRFLGELHGAPRRLVTQTIVIGAAAGGLEAGALVLFMDAALRLTGDQPSERTIGPLTWSASTTTTLVISALLVVAAAGLHAAIAHLTADGSLRVLAQARSRMIRAELRSRWSHQADQADGSTLASSMLLTAAASSTTMLLLAAANAAVIGAALLVSAVAISPIFTLVLLASLVPVVLLLGPASRYARRRSQTALTEVIDLHHEIAESETMGLELRAFNVQEQQITLLDQRIDAAFAAERGGRFSSRLAGYWFKDLALLAFVLVLLVLDLVWDLSEAGAAAVLIVAIRALGYFQQSFNATRTMIEHIPSAVKLQQELERAEEHAEPKGGRPLESVGPIVFRSVSYVYPDGRNALTDVDLAIRPGRTVGIVGRSGAGKSTIAELLLRLREPTSGSIEISDVPIEQFDVEEWRRRITFVPQDANIWRRSVADNIRFLRSSYTDADVERAARLARLHDDIVALPNGYDTLLSARSRGLSGGQRQRLAIARALLSDPWIVVLDEPTSALDSHSERDLQLALTGLRGSVTMVVIAHRISTLDLCDDLIVLDRGRVVADGPRDSVMAQASFFTDSGDSPG